MEAQSSKKVALMWGVKDIAGKSRSERGGGQLSSYYRPVGLPNFSRLISHARQEASTMTNRMVDMTKLHTYTLSYTLKNFFQKRYLQTEEPQDQYRVVEFYKINWTDHITPVSLAY